MSVLAKLKGKSWLRWLGYPAFFNLAFLGGIYLTFPYDVLRDRIVSEARNATGMEVSIEKVRLAGISGLTLYGLAIVGEATEPQAQEPAEGEEAPIPAGPPTLYLDAVTAKADLLALATGKRALRFDVDAFGGNLAGRIVQGEEEQVFTARARGIDFGQSPLQAFVGLDLAGQIEELTIDLRSPGKDFSRADGTVEIRGKGLSLQGGEVQMFELPQMALGQMTGRILFKEGVAEFDPLEIDGADLRAEVEGTVRLQPVLKNSSINAKLKIKPSDDWWNRNEVLKAGADFALPAGKDGWRTISVFGQLSRPNFRPQKN